ncbi:hypothetical protein GGER_50410 [Serratia rubidaea]
MVSQRKENKPGRTGSAFPAPVKQRMQLSAVACFLAVIGSGAQAASYVENGRPGDAASWRSNEFNAEWGLGAIHADQAYAAGYTGKGVKLGIFDQPVYAQHPEFASQDKVINLVTQGCGNTPTPIFR